MILKCEGEKNDKKAFMILKCEGEKQYVILVKKLL